MKKVLFFIAILFTAILLVGCGSAEEDTELSVLRAGNTARINDPSGNTISVIGFELGAEPAGKIDEEFQVYPEGDTFFGENNEVRVNFDGAWIRIYSPRSWTIVIEEIVPEEQP
ncbi:hypothetical protein ACFL1M_04520 [Patescibacteria group bacterium]